MPMGPRRIWRFLDSKLSVLSSARSVSWRRLLGYVWPYRWWMLAALISMLFATSVGLLMPLAVGQMINAIAAQGVRFELNQVTLIMLGVVAVQAVFSLVQTFALAFVGERVVSDLRVQAYTHLQALSLSFFSNRRTGEITSRITNDVSLIQATVTSNVATLLQGFVQFFGAMALMIAVSWQLSILALLLVPAVTLLGILFGRLLRSISTQVQDRLAEASSVLEETVSGVRVVQSFAREPYEVGRFSAAIEATFAMAMRRARVRAVFQPLVSVAAWSVMVGVLWLGGHLVLSGQMRPGDLIAFMLYAGNIGGTLGTFSSLFGQLQEALGATTRVFELIDTSPTIRDAPGAAALARLEGRVKLEDVTFGYETTDGQPPATDDQVVEHADESPDSLAVVDRRSSVVLKNLTIDIAPGEVLALVGPSGAGKSTIVNLIPRFYDVQGGRVLVDGHDVRDVQLRSLREQIGIVPQETLLFSGSVRENIRYGRLEASDAEVEEAAEAANAHAFITALPDGYDTAVGERGIKLSGGQRQRVAIARAIVRDPKILLLDEATSALDPTTEAAINSTLEQLGRSRTVISVTHRLASTVHADQILVFERGRLVETGTSSELLALDGWYKRLWDKQQGLVVSEDGARAGVEPERLRAVPILSKLSDTMLAMLAQMFLSERVSEGRKVIREGDTTVDKFYIVARGKVAVLKRQPDGNDLQVATLQDGDIFGEVALLKDMPRNATIRTLTPCIFLTLQRRQFNELIQSDPRLRNQFHTVSESRGSSTQTFS
jgi:subfamily B ATP-binding cassette protein MsbA